MTKFYRAICQCSLCKIDFTISTEDYMLSEAIGSPELEVYCPLCCKAAYVNDKEEDLT